MFSRKCVCNFNISKIVRPLSASLSVNGLRYPVIVYKQKKTTETAYGSVGVESG